MSGEQRLADFDKGYAAGYADAARAAAPVGETDSRNLTDDERVVCGNCQHVKYDHFMPGSERCETTGCKCPGFLTVPPAPDRAAGLRV